MGPKNKISNCECFRVVLTGGPGGGKTTAADLFRREIGDKIVIVPESATMLFSGGFPRDGHTEAVKNVQSAIYHVQRNLEDIQARTYPNRILLCDRGTVDGAVYWPSGNPDDYFKHVDTSLKDELARYDAVLFFETASAGGLSIEGGNRYRTETIDEALELDRRLRALWSQHPNFTLIPHQASFMKKIGNGLDALAGVISHLIG